MNLYTPILFSLLLALALAEDCEPGTFKVKAGVCRPCPKGTFQAKKNRYACRPCPPKKVSTEVGSITCTLCPKGSEPNEHQSKCVCTPGYIRKRGKCVACEPGTFTTGGRGNNYCSYCDSGTYQPKAGQTECLTCPPGTNSGSKATECITCAEDEDFNMSDMKCEKCKAGFYFDTYSGCTKCEKNRYKPDAGNGPCLPCPIGTHSKRGARVCKPCPRGTTLFKNGECDSCPAGSYFVSYQQKCKTCNFNEFMPYKNVRSSCFACSGKKFALKGATKCTSCPKHTFLFRDGKCKECPLGSIHMRYNLKCQKCRVNEFSRGDMDYCESCPNETYSLPGSTTCFTCPEDEALILKRKECGTCPAGKRYDQYEAKCMKCYNGSIKPNPGIGDCKYCPSGKSNDDRTECID